MNKKTTYSILIIISLIIITGCIKKENNISPNTSTTNKKEVINSMKILIDNKEYNLNLENNKTVESLINLLPLELTMSELNGNEKYVYLDSTLPTNPYNPKHITKGDVMLYGNNCLVIFYKSFNTTYSYTKIGHIDDLPNLDNNNINIKIE